VKQTDHLRGQHALGRVEARREFVMSEQFMSQQQYHAAGHDTEYADPRPDREEPDEEPRLKAIVVTEYELDDVVLALGSAVLFMPEHTHVQRARRKTVESLASMLMDGPWVLEPEEL
jgi:hypothetical protein